MYRVLCYDNNRVTVVATSQEFATEELAQAYASTIAPGRDPVIAEIRANAGDPEEGLSYEEKVSRLKKTRELEAEVAAHAIGNFVNGGGDVAAVCKNLLSEHRTIQQGLFRAIGVLFKEWEKSLHSGDYDQRNQATVQQCNTLLTREPHFFDAPYI